MRSTFSTGLVAFVLLAAGCGSSSNSGSASAGAGGQSAAGGSENVGGAGIGGAGIGGAGIGGTAQTAGGSSSVGCTDTATASGTFTVRYDAAEIPVAGGGKSYYAQTNWWHLYTSQTMSYDGLSFTIGDPEATTVPANDNAPTGFPSLFIGSYSGNTTTGSNLPKAISELTTVPTILSTNALDKDTSNFNAAYDVWLTATGDPLSDSDFSPGAGGAYLMVWLFKPADRQPRGGNRGQPNYPGQSVDGVEGSWDVWFDPGSGTYPPCVSYVSATPRDSLSFDLNAFIQDAIANDYGVTADMYLNVVFAGFEIWSGGDGLSVKQFCAQVN